MCVCVCVGSTAGGTLVTISGDGFTPEDTRVIVGRMEYTSQANITYTQIRFITQLPPSAYIDQAIPVTVLVGTNAALCSSGSCTFTWARRLTPLLTSLTPTSITSSSTLTLTGQNFAAAGGPLAVSSVTVTVNGQACNVTSASNATITCQTPSLPLGNHSLTVSIAGESVRLSA